MLTYEKIKDDREVHVLIQKADEALTAIGYTEHCFAHVEKVSHTSNAILESLGFSKQYCEAARIAGYLHDIGNVVNREDHAHTGALLAYNILKRLGDDSDCEMIADIVTAIGNHDERTGAPVNPIAAAIILADKTDVRAARVRNVSDVSLFDIHDRVNYSVKSSKLIIDKETREIRLDLAIDTELCPVIDYFEIYVSRMMLCRKAANVLKASFKLVINGQRLV